MSAAHSIGDTVAERPAAVSLPRAPEPLANAPAATLAAVYEAMAEALGTAMQDAVARQQADAQARSAAVSAACAKLLALQPALAAVPAAPVQAPEDELPATLTATDVEPPKTVVSRMLAASASPAADGTAEPGRVHEAPSPQDGMARVMEACNFTQTAVMSPQVVLTSAAGKAYQLVALAAGLAVLDAAENLRHVGTLVDTAAGVALAHLLATGEPRANDSLAAALRLLETARRQLAQTGAEAGAMLKAFPAG